ncbi:MAG TPA: MFS transporter, partial [Verrucomicrobiae bacterium]|nr:MFS transporter [Verrucomicrobiae bacterium]
ASDASTIASTAQQLSISIGVACASLVARWFLGGIQPSGSIEFVTALHRTFLTLGIITIVSAITFLGLRPHDGNNVSNRVMARAEE